MAPDNELAKPRYDKLVGRVKTLVRSSLKRGYQQYDREPPQAVRQLARLRVVDALEG